MGAGSQAGGAVTPLPVRPLVGIFLMNLVLGFQINVIWPFLPFMVDWLRGTSQDSATFVGILTASYFMTQFISSFIWASLATRLGMRRCLMLGLLGVGSTFLCFGLSTTFEAAFFFRSMSGLLNGNVRAALSQRTRLCLSLPEPGWRSRSPSLSRLLSSSD
jgi:MFS family permease